MEKEDLVRLVYRQSDTIDQLTHENDDLKAEVAVLKAEIAVYRGDTRHQIELSEDGFTIQHPLACRPYLFDCLVGLQARDLPGLGGREPGRYYCRLDDQDELVIEGRVP